MRKEKKVATDKKFDEALRGLVVTPDDVKKRITEETYNFAGTATTCYLRIDHVHVVSDTAYVLDPAKNRPAIGKATAFEKAFDKAFELVVALKKHDAIRHLEIPEEDRLYPNGCIPESWDESVLTPATLARTQDFIAYGKMRMKDLEILTESGWVLVDDLLVGTRVTSYDFESGEMVHEAPTRFETGVVEDAEWFSLAGSHVVVSGNFSLPVISRSAATDSQHLVEGVISHAIPLNSSTTFNVLKWTENGIVTGLPFYASPVANSAESSPWGVYIETRTGNMIIRNALLKDEPGIVVGRLPPSMKK